MHSFKQYQMNIIETTETAIYYDTKVWMRNKPLLWTRPFFILIHFWQQLNQLKH